MLSERWGRRKKRRRQGAKDVFKYDATLGVSSINRQGHGSASAPRGSGAEDTPLRARAFIKFDVILLPQTNLFIQFHFATTRILLIFKDFLKSMKSPKVFFKYVDLF